MKWMKRSRLRNKEDSRTSNVTPKMQQPVIMISVRIFSHPSIGSRPLKKSAHVLPKNAKKRRTERIMMVQNK